MAAPVFGFSVGDFIAGINIAIDVIKACKDTGGASSQYEWVIVEFEAYLALLRKLQDPNVPTSTEINRLASSCEQPVKQFVIKIEKYRSSLAKSAVPYYPLHQTARYLRTFPRKAHWAMVAKKTVDELRLGIGPPLAAISLFIELESSKVLTNIASAHQTSTALIQASAEATKQQVDRIERNQIAQIESIVKHGLSSVHSVMDTVQGSVHDGRVDAGNLHQQSNIQLSRIESQLSGLVNLTRNIAEDSSQPFKGAAAIEAIAQIGKGSGDCGELEQRDVYLIRIFDSLAAILRRWIIQTLLFLPYWRAFVMFMRSIPAVPTGLLSDNITFVDVLGREMSLSYADFRYWPVFEARLQVAFRGVPGEEKVREQEYRVLTHDHRIIDPQYWTDLVLPRSTLRMTVVLCGATMKDGVCPQPACRARLTQGQAVRDEGVMVICPTCETTSHSRTITTPMYFDRLKRSTPTLGSHYEWIQERLEAMGDRYREGNVRREPEDNEIRLFKNILVSNSPVWTLSQILNDCQPDALNEIMSFLSENTSLRQMLTENLIGFGPGPSPQQLDALRALEGLPENVIAAWLGHVRQARSGKIFDSSSASPPPQEIEMR